MTVDPALVVRGAGYALFWLVPAAFLNYLASEGDSSLLVFLTFCLILLGFAFGGYAVGRSPVDNPLQTAAAAAVLAYAVVQAVGLVVAVVRDRDISPIGIVFTALLAATTGMLGAVLARRQPV
jgi:H+/Cl- antiporter ClcA